MWHVTACRISVSQCTFGHMLPVNIQRFSSACAFLHLMGSFTGHLFNVQGFLSNSDPFKPHCYIAKLGLTGVYIIFLISAQKHRLWALVGATSPMLF